MSDTATVDDQVAEDIDEPSVEIVDTPPKEEIPSADADEIEYIGFSDEAPKKAEDESTDPWKGHEAPAWVKQTRQENRDLKRKLREIAEAKQSAENSSPKLPELGAKPTLESVGYDEDELQKRLDDWYEQKTKVAAAKAEVEAVQRKQQERWDVKLQSYKQAKTVLQRDDYEEAESAVQEALTQTQIGVLISGVKDSASLVYALGKSPAKLQALKGLDPVETAFALARLEQQVQVNRKPKVSAETPVQGSTSHVAGGANAKLEQLRNEADKTGDYSKVFAYKQQLKKDK